MNAKIEILSFLRASFTISAEKSKNILIFLFFIIVRAGDSLFVVPHGEYPPVNLVGGGEL